ncbi:MAG: hypothetical protein V7772_13225 [Pseudomonas profundi]|uniref:hypothetical protein n=1 Tax=Pseudomonas profundi TaxID=1981513 RepID=UPI003002185E
MACFSLDKANFARFFLALVVLWLVFFDLYISFIGAGASVVFALILMSLLFPSSFRFFRIDKAFMAPGVIAFAMYFYILNRSIFSGDYSYLVSFTKVLLTIAVSIHITNFLVKKYGPDFYVKLLILAFLLQSLSPWLYLFFDSFKDLVMAVQAPDVLGRDIHGRGTMALRKSFFSGAGGFFGMSTVMGFFLLVLTFFYIAKRINFSLYAFVFSFVCAAALIAGRSSIVFVVASMAVLLFYKGFIGKVVIFCFLSFLSAISSLLILNEGFTNHLADNFVFMRWMLEPILNLQMGEGVSSVSTNVWSEMWVVPELKTVLWGDGFYTSAEGLYYGGSDVGYMRQIFFGGLPMVVMSILFVLYITAEYPFFYRLIIMLALLTMHAKGNVILGAPMTMALLSSFSVYVVSLRENNSNES